MSASLAVAGVGVVPGHPDEITRMTARVTRIIAILLDRDVEPHDNIFDLGATALDAVLVGSRLSAEFGVRLPLCVTFENPTVQELVGVLRARPGSRQRGHRRP